MASYVLVHGSWHGAWCWEKIISRLKEMGHSVYAPDLPGHGRDTTPLKKITLQSYVDCIRNVLDKANEPVILVGHSMAGMIISQVAENWPESISHLVYVTAFIPQNGECLSDIVKRQPISEISKDIHGVSKEAALYFPMDKMYDFGYQHYDRAEFERLLPLFTVEPLRPYFDVVHLTVSRFGKIKRTYITCLEDCAIWIDSQRRMLKQTPCEIYELNTDHSPFFSTPDDLVNILVKIS